VNRLVSQTNVNSAHQSINLSGPSVLAFLNLFLQFIRQNGTNVFV
jgi:hypothetical protein